MRRIIRITTIIWLTFSILIAFLFFHQITKDRAFKEEMLVAPKEFIDSYKDSKGRIPTNKEFKAEYNDRVRYYIKNFKLGEYTISVWRGEWAESYHSATDTFENVNSEKGLILDGIVILIIGCIPGMLFLYFTKRN